MMVLILHVLHEEPDPGVSLQARIASCTSEKMLFLNKLMTQHMQTLAAYAASASSTSSGPSSGVMWTQLALKTLHIIKLVRLAASGCIHTTFPSVCVQSSVQNLGDVNWRACMAPGHGQCVQSFISHLPGIELWAAPLAPMDFS